MTASHARGEGRPDAYLVVPPLIKYAAGPLLGPAIVEAASARAGFDVRTVDLNIEFLHSTGLLPPPNTGEVEYYGDHCKPGDALDRIESVFRLSLDRATCGARFERERRELLWMSHDEVALAAEGLKATPLGSFLAGRLLALEEPRLLGVSVMWEWQVIPALFLSLVAKRAWPSATVVWGGSHVTALHDRIALDPLFGRFVDGFLPFHSEGSFVQLLESPDDPSRVEGMVVAGGGIPSSTPAEAKDFPGLSFPRLDLYGRPRLVLPVELSTGCAYGRCTFCTYPAIEPEYRPLPTERLDGVLELAVRERAAVSFKDSYLLHDRLKEIAERIHGRVPWSATTKLHPRLVEFMPELATGGLRTLEVGLETLDPRSQECIKKRQSEGLLDDFLRSCASHRVSVVVNYMTGLPGEDESHAQSLLAGLQAKLELMRRREGLVARPEPHRFRLERMSPMARVPERSGIGVVGGWPWSSILKWERIGVTVEPVLPGVRRP